MEEGEREDAPQLSKASQLESSVLLQISLVHLLATF